MAKPELTTYAYLHDLFTSTITYDAREVRKVLKEKFPDEELITKFRIYVARKEFPLQLRYPTRMLWPFHFADVVWFVVRILPEGQRTLLRGSVKGTIVHEVKTGKHWEASWSKFSQTNTEFRGYPIIPGHKNTLYCLWIRKEFYHDDVHTPTWVKICFLDWIEPILAKRLKELDGRLPQ